MKKEFIIQEELKKLPALPGVYLMHGPSDEVIYVGKAKVLKNRVRQYFQSSKNKSAKILQMVSLVQRFEVIVVDSELEALILENSLIKEYRPRYNTLLKDDKTYPYIKITHEDFPRILKVRKRLRDKGKYYGPYSSNEQVNEVIDLARKSFRLRACQRNISEGKSSGEKCIYFDLDQCKAPCMGKLSREEYKISVDRCENFLEGKYDDISSELKRRMKSLSDNLDFEKAIEIRSLLEAVESIRSSQKIESGDPTDRDVIGMRRSGSDCIFQIFFVRGGKIIGRDHQYLETDPEETDERLMELFIKQYYIGSPFIPNELHLQCQCDETDLLESLLSAERKRPVKIIIPFKGEKEKLVELASKNAGILMNRYTQSFREADRKAMHGLEELKNALGLKNLPLRIESYDISNTSGVLNVGSMVVYENGKKKPKDYRKFRLNTKGPDDYSSMREVLTRRFLHGKKEREDESVSKTSFSLFPDLLLMDGGKGQVGIALQVLEELNIRGITVCGMIKDDRHRTRALLFENQEVAVNEDSEAFKLITRVQDEVHRYAIEYHRHLRNNESLKSVLDDIPGIGEARRKALLRAFKDIEHIKELSIEELKKAEGMNTASAENVYNYFHKSKPLNIK